MLSTNERIAMLCEAARETPRAADRPVAEIKGSLSKWIQQRSAGWPGLRAAHFVGGIASLADDAIFPAHKDVDLHLVFDEDSTMLQSADPFMNVIEDWHEGLMIEAGVKSVAEYATAHTVLANPEIAHHLTRDCVIYDDGVIATMLPIVRREYARRRWVHARVEHELRGLRGAMEMLEMARAAYGASGEVNISGYSFTFIAAMLDVASLRSPSTGSGISLHIRRALEEHGRLPLYDDYLRVLGVADLTPQQVETFLEEGAEAFDLAVRVKRTPVPFGHKLNAHLRPYFVQSCRTLIEQGHHREAAVWLTPFFTSSVDVILADGPRDEHARFSASRDRFFDALGKADAEARAQGQKGLRKLHSDCIELASAIMAGHPGIID